MNVKSNMKPCGDGKEDLSVIFNVDVGGVSGETVDAKSFSHSPIQLQIGPGAVGTPAKAYAPIVKVPREDILRIDRMSIMHFSCQGKQDLAVKLKVGNQFVFQSGKRRGASATPPFGDITLFPESRTRSVSGGLFQTISVTGGGVNLIHDNFSPNPKIYGLAFGSEVVTFEVDNYSDVYTHQILLAIQGWTFSVKAKNHKSVMEALRAIWQKP